MKEFSVPATINKATGYEGISVPALQLLRSRIIRAEVMASRTLSSARFRIGSISGLVNSAICSSSGLMRSAVSFKKGYFAKSFGVHFTVSRGILLFSSLCLNSRSQVESKLALFRLLAINPHGHVCRKLQRGDVGRGWSSFYK